MINSAASNPSGNGGILQAESIKIVMLLGDIEINSGETLVISLYTMFS